MQADVSQPAEFLRPSLEGETRHLSPVCIYARYDGSLVSAVPSC